MTFPTITEELIAIGCIKEDLPNTVTYNRFSDVTGFLYKIYINTHDCTFSMASKADDLTGKEELKSVDDVFYEIKSKATDIYDEFNEKINLITDILLEFKK